MNPLWLISIALGVAGIAFIYNLVRFVLSGGPRENR